MRGSSKDHLAESGKDHLVEEVVEEAPPALAAVAIRTRRVAIAATVGTRRVLVIATAAAPPSMRWRWRWRRRRGIRNVRRRLLGVVGRLRARELFQLTTVEEDASAALTLLDVYAALVDGFHHALALWASHAAESNQPNQAPGPAGAAP